MSASSATRPARSHGLGVAAGSTAPRRTGIGLVLGAGGTTGAAFHAGTLLALQQDLGWDPNTADVIVGSSAGSIVGGLLRAGLTTDDLSAWGTSVPGECVRVAVVRLAGLTGNGCESVGCQRASREPWLSDVQLDGAHERAAQPGRTETFFRQHQHLQGVTHRLEGDPPCSPWQHFAHPR